MKLGQHPQLTIGRVPAILVALLLGSLLMSRSVAFGSAFTNGSFEIPALPGGGYLVIQPGTNNLPGWTVGLDGGPLTLAASGSAAAEGTNELVFNSGNNSPGKWVAQTFNTTSNQDYTITFNVRRSGGPGRVSLKALVRSQAGTVLAETDAAPSSPYYGNFELLPFTAKSAATTLEFADSSTDTTGVDVVLDNVALHVRPPTGPRAIAGLVGWWRFEEGGGSTAADSSGHDNHGTIVGAVWATGQQGFGLRFDGIDDQVTVSDSSSLNLSNAITIAAWVKAKNWERNPRIVGKSHPEQYTLLAQQSGLGIRFLLDGVEGGDLLWPTVPSLEQWHYVAGTYDGARQRIYIDGVLAEDRGATGLIHTANGSLAIGGVFDSTDHVDFFDGTIDEVRIYDRALAPHEIGNLYLNVPDTFISGVISSDVPQAGDVWVTASPTPSNSVSDLTIRLENIPTGPLTNVPYSLTIATGVRYWLSAFRDIDGNGSYDWGEPNGYFPGNPVLITSNRLGADLILGDQDADGMPDQWESHFGLNPTNAADADLDFDGDGISNLLELRYGTRPNGDTDNDGVSDFSELFMHRTSPFASDTDNDGFSDFSELFVHASNPSSRDSDADGMPDAWELEHGLNTLVSDAGGDLDLDGLSNLQEYENGYRPDSAASRSDGLSDYERVFETQANRFYYDKADRLVGADYNRGPNGLAIGYSYDGNGSLLRQWHAGRDANNNRLPDIWEFLNGLTNNTSAFTDSDGDRWTDFQEREANTSPTNRFAHPGILSNAGTKIDSVTLRFVPSNFVVGVGQLIGLPAHEVVVGADGDPGTTTNFLTLFSEISGVWRSQQFDVGSFGITSIAVGQVTNRPGPAIYAGLRHPNGTGKVLELMNVNGGWQTNVVFTSTNEAAFVFSIRGPDLVASFGTTNAPTGTRFSLSFSDAWNIRQAPSGSSHRGLGMGGAFGQTNQWPPYLLDSGGIQITGIESVSSNLNQGVVAYYPLDGHTLDASGNLRHGNNNGAAATWDRFGIASGALRFNGTSSYVRVPSQLTTDDPFTWSLWYRMHSSSTNAFWSVLNQAGDPGAARISPAIYINTIPEHTGRPGAIDFFTFDNPNPRDLYSQVRSHWDTNSWYYLVVSCDDAGIRTMYVNGVVEAVSSPTPFGHASPNFYIGADPAYSRAHFPGDIDEVRIYSRALSADEVTSLYRINTTTVIPEPTGIRIKNWRGYSLASGSIRGAGISVIYACIDDKNTNDVVDAADDFIVSEFMLDGPIVRTITSERRSIRTTAAQSYGVAAVNFLRATNEQVFTAHPDGQVFAWTAIAGGTNPMSPQIFSSDYAGKEWHALAGVKTLETTEGLVGLVVAPNRPNICELIYWEPEARLPQAPIAPQTAPIARVLPDPSTGGVQALVPVRLWDAEGNACLPLMEYRRLGETDWHTATIVRVGSTNYSLGLRVAALPSGTNHVLLWDAYEDLGSVSSTNVFVFLRVRARDVTLLGDWSEPSPYWLNFGPDSDGDGLDDVWELQYAEDLNALSGNADSDRDGHTDGFEYLANTDPTDANSALRLALEVSDTHARLQWSGSTNFTSYLERSSDAETGRVWQSIFTNVPGISARTNYFDTSLTNQMFYRLRFER